MGRRLTSLALLAFVTACQRGPDLPPAAARAVSRTDGRADGRHYVVVSAGEHGGFGIRLSDVMVAFALR